MKRWRTILLAWLVLAPVSLGWFTPARAQSPTALILTFDGPLTPALAGYVERGIEQAQRDATIVILNLNTPGGQIDTMDDIVDDIRASRVPVVVYVSPRGAMAGSAGTVITLAGHASAMAPETIIGAASPVGGQGEDLQSTMEDKVKEALKAKVRALAAHRAPEAIQLAEATIENAKAATADEAYAVGLVDILAEDVPDLLNQLDGRTVIVNNQAQVLATRQLTLVYAPLSLLETVLNFLVNPNVVYLLLALGTQAILIEFSSPGGWVVGFVGVVCLVLAFYGLGVLPVNWFGILFIIMAVVLFVMDINATSHGGLTLAAIGSLITGALVLFNSPGSPEFFQVNVPLVVGTSLALGGVFFAIMLLGLRARLSPATMGTESLVGREGEARSGNSVQVAGELWSAEAETGALEMGQKVIVTAVKGLKLLVRRK